MNKALVLTAAFVACLCLSSCEGLFNPEKMSSVNPERTAEQEFWGVVGQLVGNDQRTDDYEGATFKPTIGSPDNGDESVRVVAVNSLEGAVERYNNLVGADITTETSTYTYKSKEVGTLTWNKSSDNKSWGTVDVSVAAVPSLQKIIYRSPEQGDVNGSVGDNGSAYYRFGDVIVREVEGGQDEYWICVRPAFHKEGKEKCHWVTVSPLPKENLWPYYDTGKPFTASNGFDYGLPYNLGTDLEWHQDLAELLFAIMYPSEWFQNIGSYSSVNILGNPSGLPIFNDFHSDRIRYHNIYFWQNVQRQWKDRDLVKKIFGISYDEMAKALNPDPNNLGRGLHLLYDEYSWSTKFSNKPKLYQVHYAHGTKDTEKNMHKRTKSAPCAQVVEPKKTTVSNINYPFDIFNRQQGYDDDDGNDYPWIIESRFFGDDAPRWCVRYATGAELCGKGKYDAQQPLKGFEDANDGEVYRYYRDVLQKNLTDEAEETPEVTAKVVNERSKQKRTEFDGKGYYGFGDVLKDEQGKRWIVVNVSGGSTNLNAVNYNMYSEMSPYAELVSFEGLTLSNDGRYVTNAVTEERLLRVSVPLWFLVQEVNKKWAYISAGHVQNVTPVYENIKKHAEVDLHTLMPQLSGVGYNTTNEQGMLHCSFAYSDPKTTPAGQPLYRFINDTGAGNEFITIMFPWYPKQNVLTNNYPALKADDFSSTPIYLQDVANAQAVSKYADDFLARAPYQKNDPQRTPRQSPETRASDITNYYYNNSTWTAGTMPLGMWNEPVLFIRATALYDRGSEYATETVDGQKMTMVSRGGYDNDSEGAINQYAWYQGALCDQQAKDRFIKGSNAAMPDWRNVW